MPIVLRGKMLFIVRTSLARYKKHRIHMPVHKALVRLDASRRALVIEIIAMRARDDAHPRVALFLQCKRHSPVIVPIGVINGMFDAVEKALIPQVFSKEMGGQPEICLFYTSL